MRVVSAVVEHDNVHEIDAEGNHDLWRDFGPAVNNELDDCSHDRCKSLRIYFQSALLERLDEMPRRFGVDILQISHTLTAIVVLVVILDCVEESY